MIEHQDKIKEGAVQEKLRPRGAGSSLVKSKLSSYSERMMKEKLEREKLRERTDW